MTNHTRLKALRNMQKESVLVGNGIDKTSLVEWFLFRWGDVYYNIEIGSNNIPYLVEVDKEWGEKHTNLATS